MKCRSGDGCDAEVISSAEAVTLRVSRRWCRDHAEQLAAIKVTISSAKPSKTEIRVADLVAMLANGALTRAEILERVDYSDAVLQKVAKAAVEEGLIVRGNGVYSLPS